MKRMNLLAVTLITAILTVTGCSKDDSYPTALDYINDITGSYEGVYITDDLKTTSPANADIQSLGGYEIQIHCYGEILDTTFMMDIYANHDSIMVCATGNDFEETYGHMQGENHMNNHGNNENEWDHHMGDEHEVNDQHFGGFNISHHSFEYTFIIASYNSTESIRFEGVRQE